MRVRRHCPGRPVLVSGRHETTPARPAPPRDRHGGTRQRRRVAAPRDRRAAHAARCRTAVRGASAGLAAARAAPLRAPACRPLRAVRPADRVPALARPAAALGQHPRRHRAAGRLDGAARRRLPPHPRRHPRPRATAPRDPPRLRRGPSAGASLVRRALCRLRFGRALHADRREPAEALPRDRLRRDDRLRAPLDPRPRPLDPHRLDRPGAARRDRRHLRRGGARGARDRRPLGLRRAGAPGTSSSSTARTASS